MTLEDLADYERMVQLAPYSPVGKIIRALRASMEGEKALIQERDEARNDLAAQAKAWASEHYRYNEAMDELEVLRNTLRLLWEQATAICGPAGATIERAFTEECRAGVVAALGEAALKVDEL